VRRGISGKISRACFFFILSLVAPALDLANAPGDFREGYALFANRIGPVVAIAIALSSAAGKGAAPTMFKGGPALTGVYAATPPRALTGIAFTFRTGGPIRGTPVLGGDTLYFGSADHHLYAIDARDGRERWRLDVGAPIPSSPAVANGLVYFTARDRRLHAVDAATGQPVWAMRFGPDLGDKNYWDFYMSSPVLAGGRLLVGGGDGRLYAFAPRTGRILWTFNAHSRIRSTPAFANGIAVFGGQDGKVRGVDAATGRLLWAYATEGASHDFALKQNDTTSIYSSPSIADGVVTIGARDSYIYGLDLHSGRLLWKQTHDGSSWILSTAAAEGHIYIGSGSAFILQAADLHSGKEQWRFKTEGAIFGSPSIAGDVLLFADIEGNLYALNRADGHLLWRMPLADRSFSTPLPANDMVYVGGDDGLLYGLSTAVAARSQPEPRRLVYFEGGAKEGFHWFNPGVDQAILSQLAAAGYDQVDAGALRKMMEDQIREGGRSILIFADNKLPASVADRDDDQALIRRYLDHGGRVVFLGTNPLAFIRDKDTGEIASIDPNMPSKVLGLSLPEPGTGRGYHVSEPTAEGRRWGLRDSVVASNAMRPQAVTVTLSRDEYGMATCWAKDYPDGGMLIQLALPRNRVINIQPYELVAEHGL